MKNTRHAHSLLITAAIEAFQKIELATLDSGSCLIVARVPHLQTAIAFGTIRFVRALEKSV